MPKQSELTLDPAAAYVHFTTNNTIFGTEWHDVPDVGSVPLVADTSSDIFSRPIDVGEVRAHLRRRAEEPRARPALTLVIIRDDLVARTPASLPTMLQYARARREQVDVQHAARVRRLHHAARAQVAA